MYKKQRRKIVDEMREWLSSDRNQSFHRDEEIDAIKGALEQDPLTDKEKALIGVDVGLLSAWYLTLGAIQVEDGNSNGWSELMHGMRMNYLHARLLLEQWDKDTRRTKQAGLDLPCPSFCLAMAMTFKREDLVHWLGQRLEASVENGCFDEWGYSHLPVFMLELYRRYAGREDTIEIAMKTEDASPYKQIFEQWDNEQGFAEAVRFACDFHVGEIDDRGDEDDAEFLDDPFNIIPFEIHALAAVRRRNGLTMPKIDHPLLSPPFDTVPPNVPDPQDELLDRVELLL